MVVLRQAFKLLNELLFLVLEVFFVFNCLENSVLQFLVLNVEVLHPLVFFLMEIANYHIIFSGDFFSKRVNFSANEVESTNEFIFVLHYFLQLPLLFDLEVLHWRDDASLNRLIEALS